MLEQGEVDRMVEEARSQRDASTVQGVAEEGSRWRGPRPYDFRRPGQLTKDQMEALELVHRELAEGLSSYLSVYLRGDVVCKMEEARQGKVEELFAALGQPPLYHLFRAQPLASRGLVTMDSTLTWAALEHLLGGGEAAPAREEGAELSEIARGVVEMFVGQILACLPQAWRRVVEIDPQVEESTTNPQWVRMALGQGEAVLLALTIHLDEETQGRLSFLWPVEALKPVAAGLDPTVWVVTRVEEPAGASTSATVLRRALGRVTLPVRVILGRAEIAVEDWMRLQPGDVLRLDRHVYDPLPVLVGDRPRLLGRAGRVGSLFAVRVEAWLPPEEGAGGDDDG